MSQQLKRLAVFGGSGQTGRVLCKQALERNYALSILARNPELLPSEIRDHPNVNILKGDVTNADDVFRTIVNGATEEEQAAGVKRGTAHAVLSCLGTQILRGPPAKCHSLGVRNMISAMKSGSTACNKLVVMSAVGVGESAKDVPFWARPARLAKSIHSEESKC